MPEATQQAEPTMEEILASIRRIISEDEPQAGPQAGDQSELGAKPEAADFLELTRKVTEDGTIVDLDAERAAAEARDAEPVAEPEPEPEPLPEFPVPEAPDPGFEADQESLLSSATQFATVDSLSQVASAALKARTGASGHLGSGRNLDEVVLEALTPVLKAWLDTHLSPLVEEVVREEIKMMVRRAEDL